MSAKVLLRVWGIVLLLISIAYISCEEELLVPENVSNLSASDGTHFSAVMLTWDPVPDAHSHILERYTDGSWVNVHTSNQNPPPFFDGGFSFSENKWPDIDGAAYQYRIKAYTDEGESEEWATTTGYPKTMTAPEITNITLHSDGDKLIIQWSDGMTAGANELNRYYSILRADELDPNDFDVWYEQNDDYDITDGDPTTNPPTIWVSPELNQEDLNKNWFFKIEVNVSIDRIGNNHTEWISKSSFDATSSSDYDLSGGGGSQTTSSFTTNDLDNVIVLSSKYISDQNIDIISDGTAPYVSLIKTSDASGFGEPSIMKYSSSWQETGGTLPDELTTSSNIESAPIASDGSALYLVIEDNDSVYTYESDGSSWGGFQTGNHFGNGGTPGVIDAAAIGDNLYVAFDYYPDNDLKVLKWDGSAWNQVGGMLTNSGDVSDIAIQKYSNGLYLGAVTGGNTVKIWSLSGDSWTEQLTWTHDDIADLDIVGDDSNIYFSVGSLSPATYTGAVYQVTGATSADALTPETPDNWFMGVSDIALNDAGDLAMVNGTADMSGATWQEARVYESGNWNLFDMDFSECIAPAGILGVSNNFYFVYGDGTTEDATVYLPTTMKSVLFSK
ncbi:MAG: hypothetical protein GF372_11215 [Candidatus Marinimicrobia bacterium]|nr:hypothetical protein [Candidatus Neomarinimicrobiota bacterium]